MPASSSSLPALLNQFQTRYPMGCISAELLTIHQEQYVIRALIQVGGITIATAMAADSKLETAEDRAKLRVLEAAIPSTSSAVLPPILLSNPTNPEVIPSSTPQFNQLDQTHAAFGGQPTSQPDRSTEPEIAPTAASQSQPDYEPADQPNYSPTALPDPVFEIGSGTETADLLPTIQPSSLSAPFSTAASLPSSQSSWETEFQSVSQLHSTALDPSIQTNSVQTSSVQTSPVTGSLRTSKTERANKRTAELSTNAPIESTAPEPADPEPADRSEEIMRIGIEMKRLGWSTEQGREYLKRTYGKASRSKLDDAELLDFLHYLEMQPSPLQTPF